MNRVGKYAVSEQVEGLELMRMVLDLSEKDKMLMWSEGYIDSVVEKLPDYARDILEKRIEKWEDSKAFYQNNLEAIQSDPEFKLKLKGERKEFALFVMERFPEYQTLLFSIYDGKLKEEDLRKFVYRRKVSSSKRYLQK